MTRCLTANYLYNLLTILMPLAKCIALQHNAYVNISTSYQRKIHSQCPLYSAFQISPGQATDLSLSTTSKPGTCSRMYEKL